VLHAGLHSRASEDIFQGGRLGDFSKIFLGGSESGYICFFPLETKKTTFFAEIFETQGKVPPASPSDAMVGMR